MEATKSHAPSTYVVDVHTHMYYPRYIQLLRERKVLPLVTNIDNEDRLLILADDEKMGGRPSTCCRSEASGCRPALVKYILDLSH